MANASIFKIILEEMNMAKCLKSKTCWSSFLAPAVYFALLVGLSMYMESQFYDRMDRDIKIFTEKSIAGKVPAGQVETVRQLALDIKHDTGSYVSGCVMQVAIVILFLGIVQQSGIASLHGRQPSEEDVQK
jgi:hypothetical protein